MNNGIDNRREYVAFEIKDHTFAVPMKDTIGIAAGGHNTICTFLPNTPKHIKCIIDLGDLLIPIVNLPGIYEDLPIMGNYIVVLEHIGRSIGILATEAHLVKIFENSILADKITVQNLLHIMGKHT